MALAPHVGVEQGHFERLALAIHGKSTFLREWRIEQGLERKGGYPSSASFDRQLRDKYEGASYAHDRAEIKKWILGLFDDAFAGKLDGWKRGNILKDGRDFFLLGGINRASTWAAKFSDKSFAVSG